MNAIEIRNLSKSFRGMYAVDHLNMTVPQGAIYGFIGENGSGKSTTEKLICGHLVPDCGEIKLFGKDYTDPGVRVRVGALIENAGCFPGSSVYQNLMMQCINLGIENADEEIRRVLEIVRMDDNANLKFKKCSLGMKQRIGIPMALLGDPEIIILDEPTAVLTVQEVTKLFNILRKMKDEGHSIIIITHKLHEVLSISERVSVLRKGEHIATVETATTNESELTEMMVGEKIDLNINRTEPVDSKLRLSVSNLTVYETICSGSFSSTFLSDNNSVET